MPALSQLLTSSQETFQQLGWLGVLAYAGGIILLQMAIAPLSPVAVAAGLIFGFRGGLVAITLGTNLGAVVNFLISRYLARGFISRRLEKNEKFRHIDAAIGREGGKIIALLRLCPLPFGLANYAYGLTAVRFWPYFWATFFAIIPANCFFVWLGTSAQNAAAAATSTAHARHPGEYVITALGLLAFFIALRHITRLAKAAVAKAESEAAPAESQPPA